MDVWFSSCVSPSPHALRAVSRAGAGERGGEHAGQACESLKWSNSLARISTLVVQESAGVSMRVKDGLREQCIPAVVDAWAAILEVPPPLLSRAAILEVPRPATGGP